MKVNLAVFFAYLAAQTVFAVFLFVWLVPHKPGHIMDQFFGHFGMGAALVIVGGAAILTPDNRPFYNRIEAWGMIIAASVYILADTFIMHPPLGVFDGAGHSEQEHVSLMGAILVIGIGGLVMMRKFGPDISLAINSVVFAVVLAMVFLNHHQHTVAGTIAHHATIIFVFVAALLRLLDRHVEFGIALVIAGWVLYSSQMGFAHFVDMNGHSGGAWVALFSLLGFLSAIGYMLMSQHEPEWRTKPRA
ncbi:hypothetical protein [Shimia sp.]|uniref:hypothetical protein n=1 Tax=Shimia sp. TaxID=1954381 RepID=UPI0032997AA0